MKMIGHKAPGYRGTGGREKSFIQPQEDQEIIAIPKNRLLIISLIVNVIDFMRYEIHAPKIMRLKVMRSSV
jgi:hypothetical protein